MQEKPPGTATPHAIKDAVEDGPLGGSAPVVRPVWLGARMAQSTPMQSPCGRLGMVVGDASPDFTPSPSCVTKFFNTLIAAHVQEQTNDEGHNLPPRYLSSPERRPSPIPLSRKAPTPHPHVTFPRGEGQRWSSIAFCVMHWLDDLHCLHSPAPTCLVGKGETHAIACPVVGGGLTGLRLAG
jgi:hypothetical protein